MSVVTSVGRFVGAAGAVAVHVAVGTGRAGSEFGAAVQAGYVDKRAELRARLVAANAVPVVEKVQAEAVDAPPRRQRKMATA